MWMRNANDIYSENVKEKRHFGELREGGNNIKNEFKEARHYGVQRILLARCRVQWAGPS
jgi:hypothetical protein